MKRKISLLLVVVMIVAVFSGCNLIERNYDKDYAREVAVIRSVKDQEYKVNKPKYDANGVFETTVEKTYTYTSPEVKIYKSTLNNYVYSQINEISQKVSSGTSVSDAIDEILDGIIEYELTLIEADRLFYMGELYWTKTEIDELQRAVYSVIDSELLKLMNTQLEKAGKDTIPEPAAEGEAPKTTYGIKPEETFEAEKVRAAYYYKNGDSFDWYYGEPATDDLFYQWHDEWYTADTWYIEDESKYLTAYPGVFGDADQKSLEKDALNTYISELGERVENYIGITDAQLKAVKAEIDEINKVKNTLGVEYAYPMLGKTLLVKLLIGDTYLKSAKAQKLQTYIEDGVTVSYSEVKMEYERQLSSQKSLFTDLNNYKTVVKAGNLALYADTNHYVFVKHILLKFTPEQEALLKAEKERLGSDEDAIKAYKLNLAKQVTAYEHLNGEDDLTKPAKTSQQIFAEVKATMSRFKNDAKGAERAFDDLIYKYNADPGMFDAQYSRYGYAVIHDEEQDTGEFMTEFAEGARDFRDSGYQVGQVLDYYVVTDSGIHIMYYAADPAAGDVKPLNGYTTAGQYETIYKTIESAVLTGKKTSVYELYISNVIAKADKNAWATYYTKIIDSYKDEVRKGFGV